MSSTRPAGGRPAPAKQPNFWARRAGAVVVLLVVGWAAVSAISALFAGDEGADVDADALVSASADGTDTGGGASAGDRSDVAADGETTEIDCAAEANSDLCDELGLADDVTVNEPDGSTAVGTDDGADTTSDRTEAPDEPENTGPPTPSNPADVYIVGDSDAGTFGPYLQTLLAGTKVADTELNYKVSSGLARPDFFDWPAELTRTLPEVDPDIVVVTFGGNDAQGLSAPERSADGSIDFIIGDPLLNEAEWSAEYQRRAGEVMDLLLQDDRHVIWVGIPNDDNPDVTAKLAIQDRAAKAAAAERPGVVFVDAWTRFSGRDGNWAEFVIDPRDGEGKDVRADDGFHLNQNGAEILAIDIAIEVQKELRVMGADL